LEVDANTDQGEANGGQRQQGVLHRPQLGNWQEKEEIRFWAQTRRCMPRRARTPAMMPNSEANTRPTQPPKVHQPALVPSMAPMTSAGMAVICRLRHQHPYIWYDGQSLGRTICRIANASTVRFMPMTRLRDFSSTCQAGAVVATSRRREATAAKPVMLPKN
jgi:hypothetical protein